MSYHKRLDATKESYPFTEWLSYVEDGLEQYTQENCDKAQLIFDDLISSLSEIGGNADEDQKVSKIKHAVLALNTLNEELDYEIIETGEREQLCELFNKISEAAGIAPSKYGEDLAWEWREW